MSSQSRMDSAMETVVNTVIGLTIAVITNMIVLPAVTGYPVSTGESLVIAGAFTVVSMIRQYALRRLFNGRSVWSAIKSKFERRWYDGDFYELNVRHS